MQGRGLGDNDRHRLHRRYCQFVKFILRPLGIIMIPAAVPSGAAQEARYPAGTLGDIQAVTKDPSRPARGNGPISAARWGRSPRAPVWLPPGRGKKKGICSFLLLPFSLEGIVVYSSTARDYIPAAVPSGAAQEARYPKAESKALLVSGQDCQRGH